MVPSDLERECLTVNNVLLVRGKLVTPLIQAREIIVNGQTLDAGLNTSNITTGHITITGTSNQITLGSGQTTTINAPTPNLSNIYTFPDIGTNADVVLTEGAQTVNGEKTITHLLLPTTGGIPTPLTFYEEFVGTVDFTSLAFAGTQTVNIFLTRVGNMVVMQLSGISVAGSGVAGSFSTVPSGVPIPDRFRPSLVGSAPTYVIQVVDNFVPMPGLFTITTAGFFTIVKSVVSGSNLFLNITFSGMGTVGYNKFSISWIA